ncbi:MAG: helix-turn-helix transcriptional regulator [Hyphomonas oceanitis]|uniref:helix-turn-helix domain-containing protein n=1 Tax=Hyphomonas oceanitis TaxID=81033 RepID=UPI0009FC4CF5|nr:helix-turn-helix transcriptional regulator [Hyphomonas oceanitis]|tara:strand:- start:124 stop:468 length:345 start_codon:yes stop_codon:yes gene_type:complete
MESAHKEQIAAAIRAARRAKGLTQEALAERINRSSASLSNLERAQALPSLDTLILIAAALDVPISNLVEGPTKGRKSRSRIRDENELIELIRSLSTDHLRIARIQIEALISTRR